MKTVIIDRSLSGMKFYEQTKKSDVFLYVCSLFECGVDFVEIDVFSLQRLPIPKEHENYIFRLNHPSELSIINSLHFKYITVPLKFSYLITKINAPVLLETNIGEVDLFSLLKVISDNIDFTKISMLRLIGDFKDDSIIKSFLSDYNLRYTVPVDICATNNSMTALSVSIAAKFNGANAITLSFGDTDNFAALEEFLIVMSTTYKTIVRSTYISGICKAAIISSLIGNIENNNMQAIIKLYQLSPKRIELIDEEPHSERIKFYTAPKYRTVVDKNLDAMEIDDEIADEIKNIIEKHNINAKNTRQKEDFLN
ncbi:MAG: hypothetical protein LBR74_08750 [Eubacterium sp.]|jgi:hypothetical protein|nr:hypothetical protein [Eubacterium sp.]